MTFQEIWLLLLLISTGVSGQLLLKTGALKLGKVTAVNLVGHIVGIATTPEVVFGLATYAIGSILYVLLLTRVKLSVLGPATSFQYVCIVLVGHFIFRESIPFSRVVGLACIACGVVLVVWKK